MGYFTDLYDSLWDDSEECFPINSKRDRVMDLIIYMMNRTSQIFKYENTPETIKPHILERFLQTKGNVCITEVDPVNVNRSRGLYVFFGDLGGELDENYEPTLYTIANPFLKFNAELVISRDCVRGRNDTSGFGLLPMFTKYASMMNENEISLNMTAINYRISNLISADDDRTFESAKTYLSDIIAGKFGAINSTEFFEGLQVAKSNDAYKITDLIEYEQYLKASWYNEIGLNSNYNMKRERIVSAEAELTDDALIPLVENMLDCRKKMIEDVRELYGDRYDLDNWTVGLNPIWDLDNMYVTIDKTPEPEEDPEDNENDGISSDMSSVDGVNDSDNNIDEVDEDGEPGEPDEEPDNVTIDVEINVNADNVDINSEEDNDNGNISETDDDPIE